MEKSRFSVSKSTLVSKIEMLEVASKRNPQIELPSKGRRGAFNREKIVRN